MDNSPLAAYETFLQAHLTPTRLRHSLGVMQVMRELAPIYQLDPMQAQIAGLLHDAAKDFTPAQQQAWTQHAAIQIGHPWQAEYSLYLHAPVGAAFVRAELQITDPLVLDAIAMHCHSVDGANANHPLCWCLYFADILEPNRRWDHTARAIEAGQRALRQAAYAGQLNCACRRYLTMMTQFFQQSALPMHPWYTTVAQQHPDLFTEQPDCETNT